MANQCRHAHNTPAGRRLTPLTSTTGCQALKLLTLTLPTTRFPTTYVAAAQLAHTDLQELLEVNYSRARINAEPLRRTLPVRWIDRNWRKRTRKLIARMWYTLIIVDGARRNWSNLRYAYDGIAERYNLGIVFEPEYAAEVHSTSAIDVKETRSALERITNSLDTRALILATCLGAIVGALIGALVGSLI